MCQRFFLFLSIFGGVVLCCAKKGKLADGVKREKVSYLEYF